MHSDFALMRGALRTIVAAAAAVTATCLFSASTQEIGERAEVFVLGDSLSDVGNAAAVADFVLNRPFYPASTIGLCNPIDIYVFDRTCDDVIYRRSRVTDGPVAVEYLAAHVGGAELVPSFHTLPERPAIGTNYAVASAKARGLGNEDLARQVDMMVSDRGGVLPESALYVVAIGGNDAIDALQAAALPSVVETSDRIPEPGGGSVEPPAEQDADAIIAAAVDAIGASVERLIAFGARRLIVANVPDLGLLPAVRVRASETADAVAALATATAVSATFNQRLLERLESIAASHSWTEIMGFDLAAAVRDAHAAAAALGRNVGDACFDSESYVLRADRSFHPGCAPTSAGPRFENFFFWDGIHPTGATHAAIGQALIDALESQEPAPP